MLFAELRLVVEAVPQGRSAASAATQMLALNGNTLLEGSEPVVSELKQIAVSTQGVLRRGLEMLRRGLRMRSSRERNASQTNWRSLAAAFDPSGT